METTEQTPTIPHRDVTKITVVRADGTRSPIFMDIFGEPLPRGIFEAASAPERMKRALGHLGKDAVSFEVTEARVPLRGTARGI